MIIKLHHKPPFKTLSVDSNFETVSRVCSVDGAKTTQEVGVGVHKPKINPSRSTLESSQTMQYVNVNLVYWFDHSFEI